jgi:uncharacterized membrane protein
MPGFRTTDLTLFDPTSRGLANLPVNTEFQTLTLLPPMPYFLSGQMRTRSRRALSLAEREEIANHREWMIRAFSLAAGAATVRIFVGPLHLITGLGFEAVFATSFWLGFSVNLLVAEIWINYTRPHPLKKERGWIH